ncbi:MAG: hypothetical protein OJF49_000072 [Ktedonobacterales bacterium]|nr:MAG: hypothetical protein OJF49_000072 [Ktedonobacterales bacterium]
MSRQRAGRRNRGPVVLVVSPHAGRANHEDPAKLLKAAGLKVGEVLEISELDRTEPLGPRWREQGFTVAVAAGGDGTIGAVASQIVETGLPLGILPMGTSNDVARAVQVPLDLAAAARGIATGISTSIDVAQAIPATTEPLKQVQEKDDAADYATRAKRGAYFLHALTLGLNVEFARLATDVAHRQRYGAFNYAVSALESVTKFRPVRLTMRLEGVRRIGGSRAEVPDDDGTLTIEHSVVQIAAINLPVFGGKRNLRLPDVELHDRLLDFVVIPAAEPPNLRASAERWLGALERLGELIPGRARTEEPEPTVEQDLTTWPGVIRYQAREAMIDTDEQFDVTLDGEVRGHTPVLLRVAETPLKILLPASAHDALAATSAGRDNTTQ